MTETVYGTSGDRLGFLAYDVARGVGSWYCRVYQCSLTGQKLAVLYETTGATPRAAFERAMRPWGNDDDVRRKDAT